MKILIKLSYYYRIDKRGETMMKKYKTLASALGVAGSIAAAIAISNAPAPSYDPLANESTIGIEYNLVRDEINVSAGLPPTGEAVSGSWKYFGSQSGHYGRQVVEARDGETGEKCLERTVNLYPHTNNPALQGGAHSIVAVDVGCKGFGSEGFGSASDSLFATESHIRTGTWTFPNAYHCLLDEDCRQALDLVNEALGDFKTLKEARGYQ